MGEPCVRPTAGGIRLVVRVTPNAGLDRLEGIETRDDGNDVLRVRVRAVPDRGKANQAVIGLLAKALGVPKSAVALVAGDTARVKTLEVAGEPAALTARLHAILGLP